MPVLKNPFENAVNPVPTIESTRQMAAFFHRNQTVAGEPYINHPVRVAQNLMKLKPLVMHGYLDEKTIMAALLHDVLEDCYIDEAETRKVNADDLRSWGYDEETIEMVQLVTKPEGENLTYDQKTDRLIDAGNVGAILIKLADNMDNLHPVRQAELMQTDPERAKRLQGNYKPSVEKLASSISIDPAVIFDLIANEHQELGNNALQPII